MKSLRIVFSDASVADIMDQAAWFEQQSGLRLARRWGNAVTRTILRIAKRPFSAPLCHFKSTELEGLRRIAIERFPKHLIFYQVLSDQFFVVRIIHGARDLNIAMKL